MVRYDVILHCMVRYDMVRYSVVRYYMVRYGTVGWRAVLPHTTTRCSPSYGGHALCLWREVTSSSEEPCALDIYIITRTVVYH